MKNRIIQYILKKYKITQRYFKTQNNECIIFRHSETKRWFALLIMDVPFEKINRKGNKRVDLINLYLADTQVPPDLIEMAVPTYHMNPDKWMSFPLDGSIEEQQLQELIDISFLMSGSIEA